MGSRLSQPKGVAGMTEASYSRPSPSPLRRAFNSRQIVAPAAAFTMACILFVYARTSIRAAKENAQRHRQADSGGQGLDLLNESRRRHGRIEKLEEGGTVKQLAKEAKGQLLGKQEEKATEAEEKRLTAREQELKLKAAMGRRREGDGS
ncbi:hypothetical protein CAC42_1459 [Sphaceloma murrayae]|uniref:Uncharacterized protein n=1 Tax=Sphaceloma murrayae TaxID=2082308 RepID=A0A2K1QY94_9PEZI|nr:hypothetical protein CAC42_1459 [Sphaceloma murrayae]